MNENLLSSFTTMVTQSKNLVFFGGAGVSTASGIPDFRSAKGIYSKKHHQHFSVEDVISHTFYNHYPEKFFTFYKKHFIYPNAKPNNCHIALARLEALGICHVVITQNVDGLHQKAGSHQVLELHGSVLRNYCQTCKAFYSVGVMIGSTTPPLCTKCQGRIKPDVVLYEEPLSSSLLSKATTAIAKADTLIIGGTSLVVQPAASLVKYFAGKNLIVINQTPTPIDNYADLLIQEDISLVFKSLLCCLPQP